MLRLNGNHGNRCRSEGEGSTPGRRSSVVPASAGEDVGCNEEVWCGGLFSLDIEGK